MAQNEVIVGKIFTFDSSHQLIGHCGKCANVHGHTYKLEVLLKGAPMEVETSPQDVENGFAHESVYVREVSNEGFVMDFYELKQLVNHYIVDKMDHAFLARGDEPVLATIKETGVKVFELGFRTTVENMSRFICWTLLRVGLPVHAIRLWETPTGWAETLAEDIDYTRPLSFSDKGQCDVD